MKVSFRNNSFDAFNINKAQTANNNQTNTNTTSIKEEVKSQISFAGVNKLSPVGVGSILGGIVAIAAAIKYRKNIGNSIIKLMRKFGYKQTYNNIKEDLYEKNLDIMKHWITVKDGRQRSIGGMFFGTDKAKNNAIENITKYLEDKGVNIERVPSFNPPNKQDAAAYEKYCSEYVNDKIMKKFIQGEELYKKTGQNTVFVIRDLDVVAGINGSSEDVLKYSEYFQNNGCAWLTDCKDIRKVPGPLLRPGRMGSIVELRPLQEDSKEVWEKHLEEAYGSYKKILERYKVEKPKKPIEDIHWYMQDAIDKFPEQYRESSELYQKLKDTKYYPFKF